MFVDPNRLEAALRRRTGESVIEDGPPTSNRRVPATSSGRNRLEPYSKLTMMPAASWREQPTHKASPRAYLTGSGLSAMPCHSATRALGRALKRTSCSSRSCSAAWASFTWRSSKSRWRRTAALKLIKPGMDSAQVVARFEAERQ